MFPLDSFSGTLVVTDTDGCWFKDQTTKGKSVQIARPEISHAYSTVGAGDAVHAAFSLARWVWGYDIEKAAAYSQAAAAACVSNPDSTRGINRETVEQIYQSTIQN